MLFVVDVGNTNIVYGLFRGGTLIRTWRVPTDKLKIPDIDFDVTGIVVCSVVPKVEAKLKKYLSRRFKVKPVFVDASNITIKMRVKNKKEVGADRLVNAYAALRLYGPPVILVDFGTATTFDVVNAKGEYEGGVIAPGIILARDALYYRTAKLPKIKIAAPRSVVGKDTVSAMQSGLVYGYAAMVEGVVERIRNSEFGIRNSKVRVVATGGLAGLICKHAKVIDRIDPDLTLKGLMRLGYELNEK
jgi:type III pantothenate kinase